MADGQTGLRKTGAAVFILLLALVVASAAACGGTGHRAVTGQRAVTSGANPVAVSAATQSADWSTDRCAEGWNGALGVKARGMARGFVLESISSGHGLVPASVAWSKDSPGGRTGNCVVVIDLTAMNGVPLLFDAAVVTGHTKDFVGISSARPGQFANNTFVQRDGTISSNDTTTLSPNPPAAQTPTAAFAPALNSHSVSGIGFALTLPTGWQLDPVNKPRGVLSQDGFLDTTALSLDDPDALVRIDVFPSRANTAPSVVAVGVEGDFKNLPGYRRLRLTRLDGLPAVGWNFMTLEHGVRMEKTEYLLQDRTRARAGFALLVQAPARTFTRYIPIFDAIVASFVTTAR